ncbi:CPCC family cysteine-rich protein [Solibacillus cecembensis]|uniref:CPCC family cysteine-rich protein n=1 Tax=Solibacillus cecembensis TaxID=459347 RepID=UPI003CFC5ECB
MNNEFYTCPYCGYKTLEQCPTGTYEICSICYWKDDFVQFIDPFYEGGANSVFLYEAQRNFIQFGASKALFIDSVRKPSTSDERDTCFKLVEFSNEHCIMKE